MKCFLWAIAVWGMLFADVYAKPKVTYLEEVEQLGLMSGQGLACRAKKYHQFELLARAILVSKAPSATLQKKAMRVYNNAKGNTYMDIYDNSFAGCDEIVYAFNRQKIFKSVLYSDGRIKLYDGTLITPRKPYKASSLYKKDPNVFDEATNIYKKSIEKAKKNSKNAKKVPMYDANYKNYANQFE